MVQSVSRSLMAAAILLFPAAAWPQGAEVGFGGLRQDTSLPVEVASDSLNVDQTAGTAVFQGNVLITQGEMKLSASSVEVFYAGAGTQSGRIARMVAEGNVTLVNGHEAAEAQRAVYDIDAGSVVMTGDVILTQGTTALSGETLTIDLGTGTGQMEGRVRTIFETGDR
ncbi:OstA family protein precursor [Oceaniovalibus guishaninsula JLT2003]|uniref:OstA family protein n=1 Tax=Oceaniovalibus guishaninsula JLT2003 TaxID=1231392 RepID=K2I378_9RHOB|nr:lipopolysaccharide transport periplasmic protein LptA [Oceaniovalibus guishaninsula]EKE43345.1 OstA family protein precursor [Oceaniovalibus guishaninsula JLT2003]